MKASDTLSRKPEIARREFLRIRAGGADAVGALATTNALGVGQTGAQTSVQTSAQPWNAPPRGTISPCSTVCQTHGPPEPYVKALAEPGRPPAGHPLTSN